MVAFTKARGTSCVPSRESARMMFFNNWHSMSDPSFQKLAFVDINDQSAVSNVSRRFLKVNIADVLKELPCSFTIRWISPDRPTLGGES
jgi:hypothetical protein